MTRNYTNKITLSAPLLKQNNKVDVVTTNDAFYALRDEWNLLNDNSSKGNLFTSWDWLYTWWDIYKDDGKRQLHILKYTDNEGKLIGLAPLQIVSDPKRYFPCSRQLIMLGTGEMDGSSIMGEYMDLLIIPGYETAVIQAFSKFLKQNNTKWDGIKFQFTLENAHLSRLFENNFDGKKSSLVKTAEAYGFRTLIALPETYKEYLMGLKKKMRNNITRTFSRLESEQEYTIETIKTEKDCDQAISILADLNLTRREHLDEPSAFKNDSFISFHRKISKLILSNNNAERTISLRILRFGDKPVAALYSFVDDNTVHAYQSGFETETGHRYSLLTTMLTQEISNSIDNEKVKYFNFMFSDEETTYKRRYSGTSETMYNLSFDKSGFKFNAYKVIHGPIKEKVKQLLNL